MASDGNEHLAASEHSSTEVCRDYLRKACGRGQSCKYFHPSDSERKVEFCHDFQNSKCSRSNCRFLHCSRVEEEYYLQTGELPSDVEEPKKRSSKSSGHRGGRSSPDHIPLCLEFLGGACKRGIKCRYRHQSLGDIQYDERKRQNKSYNGRDYYSSKHENSSWDEYSYDRARWRSGGSSSPPGYSRQSRHEEYGYHDDLARMRSMRDYEEENIRLQRKVDALRKQVDDLTAANEVLLEQNARLRAAKAEASVLLAESHLIKSTSAITPAQVHLTAANVGAVPFPARVAAPPAAAQTVSVGPGAPGPQVITADLQALPVSIAQAAVTAMPSGSLSSGITAQVPAISSVPPTMGVTSSMLTFPLGTLRTVATPNRLGP